MHRIWLRRRFYHEKWVRPVKMSKVCGVFRGSRRKILGYFARWIGGFRKFSAKTHKINHEAEISRSKVDKKGLRNAEKVPLTLAPVPIFFKRRNWENIRYCLCCKISPTARERLRDKFVLKLRKSHFWYHIPEPDNSTYKSLKFLQNSLKIPKER